MKKLFVALSMFVTAAAVAEEATPAAPPTWENNAEASVLITSGNTEITTVGLGLGSIYRPDPWTLKGKANYLTSKTRGTKTAETYTADLRGERTIFDNANLFVAGGYLKNEFTGFKDRLNGEGGLSYTVLSGGDHSLGVEAGVGYMKENLIPAGDRSFATLRGGFEYKWKFSATADFTNTFSILENLKTSADWRLSNTSAVTAMLNDILSLKVSFKVDHLNQPVAAKKTDTTTTIALVAKF